MMKQLLVLSILLLLALSGCSQENPDDANRTDKDAQTVVFSLVNTDHNDSSRSTPGDNAFNENVIEQLEVFFFDQHSGACLFYPTAAQISKTGITIKVNVPQSIANTLFGQDIRLYVVANAHLARATLTGKTYQEVIELVHQVSQSFNAYPLVKQTSFLMDGNILVPNLPANNNNLGQLKLIRAAAKIAVEITQASIADYQAVEAHVCMDNYLDKTTIGKDATPYAASMADYKRAPYRPLSVPGRAPVATAPFYSYETNWEHDDERESYITIRVKWYKNGSGVDAKDYYYRIPFTHVSPAGSENNYALKRNYIYSFKVNIGVLGGLDPDDMVDLTPDFEIKDWTDNTIITKLDQTDYLVVEETEVEMYNIDTKTIKYISNLPVSIDMKSVYHYQYLKSGEIKTIDIDPSDPRYPKVTIEPNNLIGIKSPVPINYVPLMIHFRVKNTKGLYQDVNVIQYPKQYITSTYSDEGDIDFQWYQDQGLIWYWDSSSSMTNFNLFTVTTTSVDANDDFVIGGNMTYDAVDPKYGVAHQATKEDATTNNMISPKFVIASQRGVANPGLYYHMAQERCAIYMEGGYPRGTWRIPTVAEMLLISKIQIDENSAIKDLFKPGDETYGGIWWAAQRDRDDLGNITYDYRVRVHKHEVLRTAYHGTQGNWCSVRCIHDIWKDQ